MYIGNFKKYAYIAVIYVAKLKNILVFAFTYEYVSAAMKR